MVIVPFEEVELNDKYVEVKYSNSYLRKISLEYSDYTFENIGKSEITCVHFIMNYKNWGSITEIDSDYFPVFIKEGFINYYVVLDKRISFGGKFKVRIYHKKKKIMGGVFSSLLTISLHDDNDRIWAQPFFYPESKIYSSFKYNKMGSFYEDIKPKNLVDYFRN